MSQAIIPNGSALGAPGPVGSPICYAFADYGDPNTHADPFGLLGSAALGSTWQRIDPPDSTHAFYVKTANPTGSTNPTGTWTNK